jgi:hypothetical protein
MKAAGRGSGIPTHAPERRRMDGAQNILSWVLDPIRCALDAHLGWKAE